MIRSDRVRRYQNLKLFALAVIFISFFVVLLAIQNLLVSALIAIIISYFLSPLVDSLERAGFSRPLAITTCFAFFAGVLVLLSVWMAPRVTAQFQSLQRELPKYITGTTEFIDRLETRMESSVGGGIHMEIGEHIEKIFASNSSVFFEQIPALVAQSLTVFLLAPFLAFFLLKDGHHWARRLFSLIPNNIFEMSFHLHHQINLQMGQFIRARLMESVIVGLIVWIGLAVLHFPYTSLISVFAAVTNLIPYIGPLIGAIPPIVIGFINGHSSSDMMLVASVFLVAQAVDAVIIIPFVVAKIVDLHPVTVVLALLVGAQVLGVLGMLIAIPVASILKLTASTLYEHLVQFRN